MSTFKQFAKQAKDRLKNGFWEKAQQQIKQEKQVAATLGLNVSKAGEEQQRLLRRQIYDYDGFCQEQNFYEQVVQMLTSDEVVSNPIMRLADTCLLQRLSPHEQQVYMAKLATKYRQAVEKYHSLHS